MNKVTELNQKIEQKRKELELLELEKREAILKMEIAKIQKTKIEETVIERRVIVQPFYQWPQIVPTPGPYISPFYTQITPGYGVTTVSLTDNQCTTLTNTSHATALNCETIK